MKQITWPNRSEDSRFTVLQFPKFENRSHQPELNSSAQKTKIKPHLFISSQSIKSTDSHDFATLPFDILTKIATSFTLPQLRAASLVCKSWNDAFRSLREAMVLLKWGKRLKHDRGGVRKNLDKALDSFLKGAARGSTLAMVDAGLMYWEMDKKEAAIGLYRKAAELGDSACQFNLGITYIQAKPPNAEEAGKWFYQASIAGHVRAQWPCSGSVSTCTLPASRSRSGFQSTRGKGGYVPAMYNLSLCYSVGEGLPLCHRQVRKWMKRAADCGHGKAQFEHGLGLFSEGEMMKAVVYLELATRAGETAADRVKNVILQQLSATSRDHALLLADSWRALPSSHRVRPDYEEEYTSQVVI